ncbi:hypothetical protein QJS66_06325 [Kocuria rhizophila]|nr:hypothetical protein QJS66_06325 [Kocuria rhizophila]
MTTTMPGHRSRQARSPRSSGSTSCRARSGPARGARAHRGRRGEPSRPAGRLTRAAGQVERGGRGVVAGWVGSHHHFHPNTCAALCIPGMVLAGAVACRPGAPTAWCVHGPAEPGTPPCSRRPPAAWAGWRSSS